MPIYEFECSKCGHVFEEWGKFKDDPPSCPQVIGGWDPAKGSGLKGGPILCGGKTERLVSRTGFQLKGGGWAEDGY